MYTNQLLTTHRNKIVVVSDSAEIFTYADLHKMSNKLYQNIGHRCLVFCLCQNSIESLVGYVSFLNNKVVPLMLDSDLDVESLKSLIEIYKPEYLWLPKARLNYFNEYILEYKSINYVLIKLNEGMSWPLNENLALLLTTSGSTGSPKLVRLSYKNLLSNAESIAEYLSITCDERPVTALPMHYSFGLSIINSHLLKGATLLMTNLSIMEKKFWELVKNERATSLSGVPYTYEILKRLRFFKMDIPSLSTLTQAGGKLNIELNKEFVEYCQSTNKRFFVMYGQTEATARMSYLPCNYSLSKLGSIGIAIPGGKFSLVDNDGKAIHNTEQMGELVYEGLNVSMGYANCGDDLNKNDENNGILFTGDIAKKDAEDFYYIVGRKKRFIKLYGNRVNLDETERLLKNLMHDCACAGSDDKMEIFITESGREDEVKKYISSKTGINHKAFTVKVIDKIPKNTFGKTIYSLLDY